MLACGQRACVVTYPQACAALANAPGIAPCALTYDTRQGRGAFRAATVWRTRSQQPGGASSNCQRPSGAGGAALPMMQSII